MTAYYIKLILLLLHIVYINSEVINDNIYKYEKLSLIIKSNSTSDVSSNIPTLVYYPLTNNKNNSFPLIIFAHCLFGARTWYDYLGAALASNGYVVGFLGTYEYNLFATSEELAPDQLYLREALIDQSKYNISSPLYHLINSSVTAAMGHSLGGGSTLIVSANDTPFKAMMTLSAEIVLSVPVTNISIPSLIMTASNDCLCTPSIMAAPIYHYLSSQHKYLVNITNGTHCFFDQVPEFEEDICSLVEHDIGKLDRCQLGNDVTILDIKKQWALVIKYTLFFMDWQLKNGKESMLNNALKEDSLLGSLTFDMKS